MIPSSWTYFWNIRLSNYLCIISFSSYVNAIMQLLIASTFDLVILLYTTRRLPSCWVPAHFASSLLFLFLPLFFHKDAAKYHLPFSILFVLGISKVVVDVHLAWIWILYKLSPALQISILQPDPLCLKELILVHVARGFGIIMYIANGDIGKIMGSMTRGSKMVSVHPKTKENVVGWIAVQTLFVAGLVGQAILISFMCTIREEGYFPA